MEQEDDEEDYVEYVFSKADLVAIPKFMYEETILDKHGIYRPYVTPPVQEDYL